MNWKQFLKPYKRKVILAASGVIILIILNTIWLGSCVFCGLISCGHFSDYFDFGMSWQSSYCWEGLFTMSTISYFSAFILTLIISYFASCIAIWIRYKKFLRNWVWIISIFIIIFFILYLFVVYIASFIYVPNSIGVSIPVTSTSYANATSFNINYAKYSNGKVTAEIINTGPLDIKIESALIGNVPSKIDNPISSIKQSETATINVLNVSEACGSILAITVESGLQVSRVISC